jgi:Sortase domain
VPELSVRRWTGYAIVVAGLALISAGAVSAFYDDPAERGAAAGPPPVHIFAPLAVPSSPVRVPVPAPAASAGLDAYTQLPVALVLPGRTAVPVVAVAVRADRSLLLPAIDEVGWWSGGGQPGQSGTVVLAGHLDDDSGRLGALAVAGSLRPGERVTVNTLAGASVYRVTAVQQYRKTQLPRTLFARTGPRRLVMITCGGDYTPGRGYADNIVVTATLTSPSRGGSR